MEWGIDVSRWQGNFNFAKAKQEGITFAILKAGGGDAGLYKDGKFERNYAACVELGIPVGAYFFGQAMDLPTAQKEADYFCSLIAGKKLEPAAAQRQRLLGHCHKALGKGQMAADGEHK